MNGMADADFVTGVDDGRDQAAGAKNAETDAQGGMGEATPMLKFLEAMRLTVVGEEMQIDPGGSGAQGEDDVGDEHGKID